MSAQPSVQRQDRLTGKLVQEIARQLTVRHPDPPITPAEEEYIAVEVRRHIFKGNPLASSDIAQIISNVIGRRAPAQQQLPPRPASVSSLPLETQTNDGVSVRSRRSRGSVTPSLVRSTTSRHESICESNASVARSAASVSTRLSVVRDRDRRVLEALTQMCSATPTRESRPVVPRPIVPPVAPPLAPPPELAEAEIQARAAAAARARLAEQQLEIRRALDAQISLKKAKAIAEAEEERRERDARVAAAAQSLSADAAKVVEQRKQREEERKQNASVVAESVARKRSTRVKEIELERAMAAEEVVDHETKIRAERDQRRRAVEHLRTELLTEAEKKVRAKKQAEVEQLEYEIKLLEQMNAKVEQERLNQEKMRLDRIRAAKETQEACRHMVEANKQREHAEKSSADKVTIDGDKSFIEKERQEAARRRQQNRDTQVYLQQQILERQLRHVLQKSDDDPYANKERIEEMEAKHREAEELEVKREAQRQWRHFLDMQQKAKQAVKSVSDVAVSITRPSSNTPWF